MVCFVDVVELICLNAILSLPLCVVGYPCTPFPNLMILTAPLSRLNTESNTTLAEMIKLNK